ncbi:MAG: hypothetical protein HXS53_02225 [Theionarchaea archaeon]|nr:hypothetical protein [Theionarchaea archaeon]
MIGCLQQGIKGVHYITGDIDSMDEDGDGIPEKLVIFITFRSRSGEPLSFYDAEYCAIVTCSNGSTVLYERSESFDTSYSIGRGGGIIIPLSEIHASEMMDISVTVNIEGRGTFQWKKPGYQIDTY